MADVCVQVRVSWGDYPIGTWFLPLERAFVVGDGRETDCAIELDPGSARTVSLRLDPLRAAAGEEVRRRLGALEVSLLAVPAAPGRWARRPERRECAVLAAMFLTIVAGASSAVAGNRWVSDPPSSVTRVEPGRAVLVAAPSSANEQGDRATADTAGATQGELNRCEPTPGGANGAPDSLRVGALTVAGHPDEADPHIARETGRLVDARQRLLGAEPAAAPRTLSRAWARSDAYGHDERHARGSVFAAHGEEGAGTAAPGWSGRCQGCGAGGLVPALGNRGSEHSCAAAIRLGSSRVPR